MTPTDYVVPAGLVVATLRKQVVNEGTSNERYEPVSRSLLVLWLKIPPRKVRRFSQQLQHMQRHHYAEYRISFQYYPTGWIYDPPRKGDVVMEVKCQLPTVDVADIKIVCEWASRQWVSGPAHNAFKRLREAAK